MCQKKKKDGNNNKKARHKTTDTEKWRYVGNDMTEQQTGISADECPNCSQVFL